MQRNNLSKRKISLIDIIKKEAETIEKTQKNYEKLAVTGSIRVLS